MATCQTQQVDTQCSQEDLEESQSKNTRAKSLDQHSQRVGIERGLIERFLAIPLSTSDLLGPVDVTSGVAHELDNCGEFHRLEKIDQP